MRAVVLDLKGLETIDLSPIEKSVSELVCYELTRSDQVLERVKGADILITNKTAITADVMDAAEQLKYICVLATGTNVVDKVAAAERDIPVSNCVAYGVSSVVQHVWSMILALHTNLVSYANDVQKGQWQRSDQFCFLDYPIVELEGKTLGIIGYGNLGQGVASVASAFGMKVLVAQSLSSNGQNPDRVSLDELIETSDVISLHCPLTDDTENLFDRCTFKQMKNTAFLVNSARGGIVNEKDLADALKSAEIAGAATDVLTVEPPKDGNPLLDPSIPNLLVTPHIAWGTLEARTRIIQQTADNIQAFLRGEHANPV
ncbi:D-2-hydroxyacid dehydrogenase [Neptuniibacter sp. QD48_11]|uniref:D-2-hydroxyacid dehydrogenase n=1 Tax=unclassified Neptuniibacter TaxID=2630693 RepID=UPI0039F56B06